MRFSFESRHLRSARNLVDLSAVRSLIKNDGSFSLPRRRIEDDDAVPEAVATGITGETAGLLPQGPRWDFSPGLAP